MVRARRLQSAIGPDLPWVGAGPAQPVTSRTHAAGAACSLSHNRAASCGLSQRGCAARHGARSSSSEGCDVTP
eukprot:scaffold68792_cov58-Phaeocystis_antarctica.AAC.3